MKDINLTRLVQFLTQPRTVAEIARELKLNENEATRIQKLPPPKGYTLFEQKNNLGETVLLYTTEPKRMDISPRLWALWQESKSGQPYIWIQLPKIAVPRLKIVGISDVHYGAKAHYKKRFLEYIKWIAKEDDVFGFLNGDIIENAIDGSIGGSVYESILTPDEQIWGTQDGREPGMIELLRPIAHKLLWAQPGNHEWRTWKKTNIDPLKIICKTLHIPYYAEPIYADVLAWGHRFTFYCHHGTTGSMTKGGKVNAATRPAEFQETVDFIIMGHVHDSMTNPTTRIVRKRQFDKRRNLLNFRLEERTQYTVICPSFHGYFGSYGARAGYAPGSWGTTVCTLFNNGTYRASE